MTDDRFTDPDYTYHAELYRYRAQPDLDPPTADEMFAWLEEFKRQPGIQLRRPEPTRMPARAPDPPEPIEAEPEQANLSSDFATEDRYP
ncbi:MAG: hypothetical protein EPO32_14705 [Anaerolineae bacterium]|nr:MAG: hypothetical protein EPO32_14705 [Anaerolineae bacterium]